MECALIVYQIWNAICAPIVAFLLQGNETSGYESLERTFVISGAVSADVLLKVCYCSTMLRFMILWYVCSIKEGVLQVGMCVLFDARSCGLRSVVTIK